MKIGLGSVQFGLDYGVSNHTGKTSVSEVKNILKYAWKKGVTYIDTACSYGNSEEILGRTFPEKSKYRIVTKTPNFKKIKIEKEDVEILVATFTNSLKKMNQKSVYGLMIHNSGDLLIPQGEKLWEEMEELKEKGKVNKIGVSVYSPEDIDKILNKYTPDIIQLPLNVFDQRILGAGQLKALKNLGTEIHSRSCFLQGLLLMSKSEILSSLGLTNLKVFKYLDFLKNNQISPLTGALLFVNNLIEVDLVIVGVNNQKQLVEIIDEIELQNDHNIDFSEFAINDENIINPMNWSK